jgi:hypothetical protein
MIGHQAIRVNRATVLGREFAQMKQVQEMIAISSEARLAIVAALNDVQGDTRHDAAGLSGHDS